MLSERLAYLWAFLLGTMLITGCATNTEQLTKSQDPYYAGTKSDYFERIDKDLLLKISCIPDSNSFTKDSNKSVTNQCLYKSVDIGFTAAASGVTTSSEQATTLSQYFSSCTTSCAEPRNRVIDVLLRVTNDNCSSFLQKTFLTKSTNDSIYNFGRDALTGGTAAVAITSPPSAVGLSLGNLLLRSYESFNKTFFLNEAFQPLENAINLARTDKLQELDECLLTTSYNQCSIDKALIKLKDYSDACSLRVGLNKLQSLVHQGKNTAETEKLKKETKELKGEKDKYQIELDKVKKDLDETKRNNEKINVKDKIEQIENSLKNINEKLTSAIEKPKFEQGAQPSIEDRSSHQAPPSNESAQPIAPVDAPPKSVAPRP